MLANLGKSLIDELLVQLLPPTLDPRESLGAVLTVLSEPSSAERRQAADR
jgi:hypothetical protein